MLGEYWLWAGWITKVILYLATAISIGGAFSYFLLSLDYHLNKPIIRYITVGAILGVVSSVAGFLIQVGSFSNAGLLGMFDPTFFNILLGTPVGTVQILRTLSFGMIAILLMVKYARLQHSQLQHPRPEQHQAKQHLAKQHQFKNESQSNKLSYLLRAIIAIALLLIVYSFSQMGHVTNQSFIAQLLLSLHVTAMSLWMGSLFPLWRLSRTVEGLPLKNSMHRFGQLAAVIVGVLVVCGLTVAYLLIKDFNTLISTPYGQGFMLKLGLVAAILLLAAFNKWYFTPRLNQAKYAKQLSYTILFEMSLGLSVLLTTGYITTVIGIE